MNKYILKVLDIFGLDKRIIENGFLQNKKGKFEIENQKNKFNLNVFLDDEFSSVNLEFNDDELYRLTMQNRLILSREREIEYTFTIDKDNLIEVYITRHLSSMRFESYHLKYNPNKPSSKDTVLLFDRGDNMGLADSLNIAYNPDNDNYIAVQQKRRGDYKRKFDKKVTMIFEQEGEDMTRGIFKSPTIQNTLQECLVSTKNLNDNLWDFCEEEFPMVREYNITSKVLKK